MDKRTKITSKIRRERAVKLRAAAGGGHGSDSCGGGGGGGPGANSEDSADDEQRGALGAPRPRIKPPRPRPRKNKIMKDSTEPLYEEDVISGFAFLQFETYEDLELCVQDAEKEGARHLKQATGKLKQKEKKIKRNKIKIKHEKGGGGSHSSSEQGYICDSESDGDKASDVESDLFRTTKGCAESGIESRASGEGPAATAASAAVSTAPGSLGGDGTGGAGSFPSAATVKSGSPLGAATVPVLGGLVAPAPIRPKPELSSLPPDIKQEFKPHITQPYSNGPAELGHYPVVGDIKTGGLTTTVGTTTATVTAATSTVAPCAANLPDVKPTATLYPTPISSPAATPTLARPTPTTLAPPTLAHTTSTGGVAPVASSATLTTTTSTTTATTTTCTTTTATTTCSSTTTAPQSRVSNGPLAYSGGGPGLAPSTTTSGSGPAPAVALKYSVSQLVSPSAPSPVYNNIKPEPSIKGIPLTRPPGGVVPTSAPGLKTPIVTPGIVPTTPTGLPHPSPGANPHGSGPPTPTTPTGHHPHHPPLPGVHPGVPGPLGHPPGHPGSVHQYVVKTEPGLHPMQHKSIATSGLPRPPLGPHQHHGQIPANATIKIEPGQHPGSHPVSHPSSHPGVHPRMTPPGHPRTTPPAHPGQRQTPPHSLHSSDPLRRPYHSPYYSVGSSLPPSCVPTTTLTRPWPSPVSSLSGSAAAAAAANSRIPGLSRPILPPPSLPLGVHHPPVSAPLPPTGMFAPPPVPPTQSLGSNPLLSSSQFPSDNIGQVDLLRRELDARYLASQDRSSLSLGGLGGIGPPPSFLRAEMHHHQHQHTHVHQHLLPQMAPPPPLVPPGSTTIFSHPPSGSLIGGSATPSMFKEVSKVGLESSPSLYRASGGGLSSLYPPGLNPMVHSASTSTPFTPPQHLTSVAPKMGGDPNQRKPPKTGRWNAMHVRIAWEIYYHQQKQPSEKGVPPQNKLGPPSCHPPPTSVGPPGAPMFPTLPRPPDLGPHIMGPGPSHLPHLSHASLTPSIPGLAGLRYAAAASGTGGAPPPHPGGAPSSFHQATPGTMPGPHGPPPPHGSMFSRDGLPPGLSLPTPTSADAWRLRAPTPYGAGGAPPWPVKSEISAYDREREERERREREERERREREKRSERDEKERREREERERREREERERERERRAEHDKDRVARSIDPHGGHPQRRDGSRSPLRTDGGAHPHPGLAPQSSHPQRSNSNSGASSGLKTEASRPDSRPGSRPGSGRHSDHRSMVKHEVKDDIMIVGSKGHPPQLPPHSVSGIPPHSYAHTVMAGHHHPLSMATTSVTSSISAADRHRLLGAPYPGVGPPGLPGSLPPGYPPHLGGDPFRDPYRVAAGPESVLMRDPYRAAAAQESALRAHELAAREALLARGDPLLAREHMAREREALIAREEHLRAAASNPLSSLILNERYREQQHHQHAVAAAHAAASQQAHQAEAARDYLIRSGQLAPPPHGAPPPGSHHPGLYPPTSLGGVHHPPGAPGHSQGPPTSLHHALYPPTSSHSSVPPHHYSSLGLKTGSPLGGGPPGPPMHPAGLHSLSTHPGAPPGSHPGAPPPLGPGLPPPLISSMRGPSPSTLPRPPDKKD